MASVAPIASSLNIYVVTFNCARTLIDVDAFAAHLFRPYTTRDALQLPDILVFALEELAPIAYAFLGGPSLVSYFSRFVQAAQLASGSSVKYQHLATHHAGMTGILVLVKSSIAQHLEWTQSADVGVGRWSMGNKGAAGVKIAFAADHKDEPTLLTFVAAHLAPMEDGFERRNLDWENIVRGLAFTSSGSAARSIAEGRESGDASETEPLIAKADTASKIMFSPGSPIIFAGDLNYRSSDKGPTSGESKSFPQPTSRRSDAKHYSQLFKHEQLSREMEAGRTMHGLVESKVDFPPTYKFSDEQQKQASKDVYANKGEASSWLWSSHRWPSWTDRVLFSAPLSGSAQAFKVVEYGSLPNQPTSDHRPVFLACRLDPTMAKSLLLEQATPFPLNPHWEASRTSARRLEIIVGILSYLGLTWEGRGIAAATVVGAVGGWLIMRSLVDA